jgi:hypothetical protein
VPLEVGAAIIIFGEQVQDFEYNKQSKHNMAMTWSVLRRMLCFYTICRYFAHFSDPPLFEVLCESLPLPGPFQISEYSTTDAYMI